MSRFFLTEITGNRRPGVVNSLTLQTIHVSQAHMLRRYHLPSHIVAELINEMFMEGWGQPASVSGLRNISRQAF